MKLSDLQIQFPPSSKNSAVTGLMPIDWFLANEKPIRSMMKDEKLRSIYRGKRRDWTGQNVQKRDAYGVLLYSNVYGDIS